MLAQQAVVRDLWSPPIVRRSLSHLPVRTEHTPIDLTRTPLNFPLSSARLHSSAGPHLLTPLAAAAHGHTSTANVEIESAASITPVVVPFIRLDQYPFTITSSLALAVCASPQMKPKRLHCARVRSKSTGLSDNSILAHTSWHRLSFHPRAKIARTLLPIFKRVLSR